MKKVVVSVLASAFIFIANVVLIWPLFQGGYTQQIGSIESVFIADARFIFENFPHLAWNPYWYTGFPFHLFYTPVLPFLMALAHALYSAVSLASWYRIFVGLFYALTPVSLYFLVSFLTRRKMAGFLAALFYSFLPSIGYFIPQVGTMAGIHGKAPWRLLTLILFGEGGHIAGLFFLPLALLFFIKAIRKASRKNIFWASFLTAWLALTNLIGLIGFAVMLGTAVMVELMSGRGVRKLGRALLVSFFSFGLAAFWFNYSFVKASFSIGTGGVGGGIGEVYLPFFPLIFFLIPAFFIFAFLGKKKGLKPIFIGGGWVLIFLAAAYFWFKNETMLLPQPNRYFPEMDMGTALLLAWGAVLLIEALTRWLARIFYVSVVLLILYVPSKYINQVWQLTQPHGNIEQTSEYQIASWLKDNTQGERVYATGTSAFWLNTFPDRWQTPQVRGGNDGVANPWVLHAVYQINTGENAPRGQGGEVAVWWLRVLNVSYLVVNLPSSREVYHDFRIPERFTGVKGMEELVEMKGDVIYQVPLGQPSLAQAVKKADFENLPEPENAVDMAAVEQYVDYIDPPSSQPVAFSWVSNGRAKIEANLDENEGVAVQVSYDPGWRAYLGRQRIPVKSDPLGFIFLDPPSLKASEGPVPVEIELVYGRTWDVWLGYVLTVLTIVSLFNGFIVALL